MPSCKPSAHEHDGAGCTRPPTLPRPRRAAGARRRADRRRGPVGHRRGLPPADPTRPDLVRDRRGARHQRRDLGSVPVPRRVRSDSDMFTLGFPFRPWTGSRGDRRRRRDPALPARDRGRLRRGQADQVPQPGRDGPTGPATRPAGRSPSRTPTPARHRAHLRLPVPVRGLLPLRRGLHAGLARAGRLRAARSCTRSTGRRIWT